MSSGISVRGVYGMIGACHDEAMLLMEMFRAKDE